MSTAAPCSCCVENGEKRRLLCTAAAGIALAFSFFGMPLPLPVDPAWAAVALCGIPILKGAAVGLVTEFDVKADVLVSMALIASACIGEVFAAGEVAFIMSLGSLLEERTVRKAREGIENLVAMTPRTARVLRGGIEEIVPAESIQAGDTLRVLPGETIAVDGVIISGETSVDQSPVTGESLPADKGAGDGVFSGTINQFGAFAMRALKTGEDSSLQRMIRLVESADASKTPIVRIMDLWASRIVVAALLTAVATWLHTGETIRAVTILVVFCPCALVLATPTAVMAGIGNATRFGVLIASGDALERLAKVTLVAFDKTGTLTRGKPEVVATASFRQGMTDAELLALAATIEGHSEHPLGRAIVRHAENHALFPCSVERCEAVPGRGVSVETEGKRAVGGTLQFMRENGMEPSGEIADAALRHKESGSTVVYIGIDGAVAGIIALADTARPDAGTTVGMLRREHVRTILLTGDDARAARHIADAAGIGDVRAGLLPEDKAGIITNELQKRDRDAVCMVGDGINDAPALKAAHVGIAMGGTGSSIAVGAADAVLVRDDIQSLPRLLKLAKKTVLTIKVNISLSLILNLATVALAAMGLMGPALGALAHNVGALLIVLNSIRLLQWRPAGATPGMRSPQPESA